MKLKNLGELNKLYNFQNTDIFQNILCEIFEQRSSQLQKLFKFNPKKVLQFLLVVAFTGIKVSV